MGNWITNAALWKRRAAFFFLLAPLAACGTPPPATTSPAAGWFTDRAEASGIHFTHANGMSGKFEYAEIIGSGAALFDMDNDGDLDVFLVQYRGQSRLFRNDLHDGKLSFTDVTEKSGIVTHDGGMGVAAGDFNNDGCVDLYVTYLGQNQLFRNNCDGTFTDVSKSSRTDGEPGDWSVSAAWIDYDRDGWPDLFVGHYLNWSAASSMPCHGPSGRPDYCSPNVFQPQPSRLYHNNRDGTFTDVTAQAGLATEFGPALGISTADFDGDGWIDMYVANDGQPNQLWINQRNGTFRNVGLQSGTALSTQGKAKAGMGVDAGDVDNDGDEDLLVTNLTGEGTDLYVNNGMGLFEEQSARSGLGVASRAYTGFGTAWLDVDNDGRLDTLAVNGAVQTIEALRRVNDPLPLHQLKLLFRNVGDNRFENVTSQGGEAFTLSEVGRGAAFGDVDNDGATDVLVNNNNGKPRLLINKVGAKNHWIGLRLASSGRLQAAPGARVQVILEDGSSIWRRSRADGSYASANDPRVLIGLGSNRPVGLHVIWPDGKTEEWTSIAVDRYTTITEGGGK